MRRYVSFCSVRAAGRFSSAPPLGVWSPITAADTKCNERVVAIADIHGDMSKLQGALTHAGLVDPKVAHKWVGGQATCVQLGDLVDRGADDKAILDYVEELRTGAAAEGGKLVTLIGNHEMMNIGMDLHYVTKESFKNWGGKKAHAKAFGKGGEYNKRIGERFKLIHVEMDTVFVHAGLRACHAAVGVERLNENCRRDILGLPIEDHDVPRSTVGTLTWDREMAEMNQHEVPLSEVEQVLHHLAATQIVLGHTPHRSVQLRYDGRVVLADTGMSRGMFGSNPMFYQVWRDKTGGLQRGISIMKDD